MFRSLALVPVLAITAAVNGATIHVDIANCPGPGDGLVGDPYRSIQTAIDNAVDTDEIEVAEVTYLEAIDFSGMAIAVRSTAPTNPAVVQATVIDGIVGINDFLDLLAAWGPCP